MARGLAALIHSLPLRVATKFATAFSGGAIVALGVVGFFVAVRESRQLESTVSADLRSQGSALAPVLAEVWAREGQARAREVLRAADDADSEIALALDARPSAAGRAVVVVPIATPDGPHELVLSKPTPPFARTLAAELEVVAIGALALAIFIVAAAYFLGEWLVGAPIRRVVDRARRVGEGDLAARLEVRGSDEIAGLKRAINAMCDALCDARDRAADEERRRLEAVERLRHADRLTTVGTLAAGIAHELGTPLNVITLQSKLLERACPADARVVEGTTTIRAQAERMVRIVRQLLDFARRKEPARAPSDVTEVASSSVALVSTLAKSRGCTVEVVPAPEPVVAPVDAPAIQQVLTNMLVNAFDAMPGGGRVEVRTTRTRQGDRDLVCIEVEDEGVGIAEDARERVFEPFFTTKDVGKGTGLGLSVALGITEDHGGFIEVRPGRGRGTVFAVFLPS